MTTWTNSSSVQTTYEGREVTNMGATMDSSSYTMDSTTITMDDMKLQDIFAPETGWTNPSGVSTVWT